MSSVREPETPGAKHPGWDRPAPTPKAKPEPSLAVLPGMEKRTNLSSGSGYPNAGV